ncbi:hypothetical protein ACIQOU_05510 [Streptomyces sp. NPDC091279]|uniref:hypothetical protein n=1 Tax=Streptomyces sp. NPDC091279 TaxID=3365983 RepID=UPI00380D7401
MRVCGFGRTPVIRRTGESMRSKTGSAALAAAAAALALTVGCSPTGGDRAATAPPPSSVVLTDADSHGYITFDTDRQVLTGYTHGGKRVWEEDRYFPTDVHCAASCPDAAVSATADMNKSASGTQVLWKQDGHSTTQSFTDKSLVVQWARDKDTWVATTSSGISWSDHGTTHKETFAKGLADSMGRLSADNGTLLISIQENGGNSWSVYRFPLNKAGLSPSRIATDLPGSVGCLSPEQDTMWTLGDKAFEFNLTTGKKIRDVKKFASDCASSKTSTVLGAFSADPDQSTQEISITSGSRATTFQKVTVRSSGEISVFRDCAVLLSNGKLTTLSARGTKTESEIDAHSMRTLPDGHVYSVAPSGKVAEHRIDASTCRIV